MPDPPPPSPSPGPTGRPGGSRTILHVDMDAFFASVELLRRPELVGQPVVVGGAGPRGVVAAASYEARWFGVRSAMASSQARRRCPQAVFLAGDHAHYRQVSATIMAIMARYTPLIEPLSLDEAFLDVSSSRRLHGTGHQIATKLRTAIYEETGLWCSAGVAPTKFLAKLASEEAKPKPSRRGPVPGLGVFEVLPGQELAFLHPLPARALWGLGAATMAKLDRIGVLTVGDIAALDVSVLKNAVGEATGNHLNALANGRDDRAVEPNQRPKSMSQEETYATDRRGRQDLNRELVRMSDALGGRLRKSAMQGRTVTVKVRFGDFRTITRSRTLDTATDSASVVQRTARELLDTVEVGDGVRLLGVGITGLDDPAPEQLSLTDLIDDQIGEQGHHGGPGVSRASSDSDWKLAERAIDEIRNRFGTDSIGPATLVENDGITTRTENQRPWG